MSLLSKALMGGLWFSIFRGVSQCISWCATIVVARMLTPNDYGLMEMATILTGYVSLFIELGVGAVIIQRDEIRDVDLDTLFWFNVAWGVFLGFSCIGLGYVTVSIYSEPATLRITQLVSILFPLMSLIIVPRSLMHREMRFKEIGMLEAISVIVACMFMIGLAYAGAGVWTLIGGTFIKELSRLVLFVIVCKWYPTLRFEWRILKSYLRFGAKVTVAQSLFYFYSKSDRFFGGRMLGPAGLGFYTMALQLATIPSDKILSLINTVAFPVFSKLQKDTEGFRKVYLGTTRAISLFMFPLYVGGTIVSDSLIPLLLGSQWIPAVMPFKLICLSQLVITISSIGTQAMYAKGKPQIPLFISLLNSLLIPFSFYYFSRKGLASIAIPWVTVYPLTAAVFILITLREVGIGTKEYLDNLMPSVVAVLVMLAALFFVGRFHNPLTERWGELVYVCTMIATGAFVFSTYVLVFQKSFLLTIRRVWRKEI